MQRLPYKNYSKDICNRSQISSGAHIKHFRINCYTFHSFQSLSMSSSLCYAFLFITRFEAMGVGASWSQIWEAPDNTSDMNIAIAVIMVIVDGIIYLIVGLILNRFYGKYVKPEIVISIISWLCCLKLVKERLPKVYRISICWSDFNYYEIFRSQKPE